MKKFLQPLKEWTVVRQYYENGDSEFYAFNTLTGARRPARKSYEEAEADFPKKMAEPWGV
jgi:hypothetical protein